MMVGWISLYQTQGMTSPLHVFQDARFAKSRTQGWEARGLVILERGHHLTIFADTGNVLWSGRLRPRRNWLALIYSRREVGWFPENTDWKTWHGYFCQQPPLPSELQFLSNL
jgi:hypothetical protein